METNLQLRYIDFDEQPRISLIKAYYINIEQEISEDKPPIMRTKDSYKLIKITPKHVELEFKREKFFEPKAVFEAEIVLTLKIGLKTGLKIEKDSLLEEIEKNKKILFTPAGAHASMIIGQLTNIHLKTPILDPPYFIEGKDDD